MPSKRPKKQNTSPTRWIYPVHSNPLVPRAHIPTPNEILYAGIAPEAEHAEEQELDDWMMCRKGELCE